ncbi:MAG: hypothetical protein ACFB5Z_13930 [Elainellaceae cyanobacterium]
MTGFIRRLFGSKQAETDASSGAKPKNTGAYYLKPDDAKTYGDIDYMRTAKTVKRTFPKGDARIRSVSSDQDINAAESVTNSVPNSTPPAQMQSFRPAEPPSNISKPSESTSERRKPDNNMDMFRNMAKDIRK